MRIKKIEDRGLIGALKSAIEKLKNRKKGFLGRLAQCSKLKKNDFSVDFIHEGSTVIKLPYMPFLDILFARGEIVKRNIAYAQRPNSEVLLRKTIFEMYASKYINSKLSIIDIGSWISDNSIVWAKYLSEDGMVFAIDPSSENLLYGKKLAEINDVRNIKWVEAVCAEQAGIKLDFDGAIDHASFKNASSEDAIESSTIDKIVSEEGTKIGLLHVDVEGFELSVLKGAESVINRDMPVISFEQHISKEDFTAVSEYLKPFGYRIFMINEVLPGCDLDCRNFLALPSAKGVPVLAEFQQSDGRSLGIYSAVIGNAIIEV